MSNSIKVTIPVEGMHCASCASVIEGKLKKLEGVISCEVSLGTEKAKLEYDPERIDITEMNNAIDPIGYHLQGHEQNSDNHSHDHSGINLSKEAKLKELKNLKQKVQITLPITLLVFFIMTWELSASLGFSLPMFPISMEFYNPIILIIATFVMFGIGMTFIKEVGIFIRHRVANMYTLVGIGTLTAYIFSAFIILFPQIRSSLNLPATTYFDVTIIVIGFVTLGRYLESKSKFQTGESVEKLINLQSKSAIIFKDGVEQEVDIKSVKVGNILIVKPGGRIPLDGVVLEGTTSIDESMITGEPIPVDKNINDIVVGGTINKQGYIKIKATKVGFDTTLSQIINLVEEAQQSKAPIQKLADKVSSIFVPLVLVIALITLIAWLIIGTATVGFNQALSLGLLCFVGVLVIACPCALGLATPTAIVTATGLGARNGILIKNAESLEKLHKVKTIVLDKTGTITEGKPSVTDIYIEDASISESLALRILASIENNSEHPIAKAIIEEAKKRNVELFDIKDFAAIEGKGVKGMIPDNELNNLNIFYAGNKKLIETLELDYNKSFVDSLADEGKTPILLAGGKDEENKKVLAVFAVSDKLKENSAETIEALHKLGLKVVILTGDDKKTADYITKTLKVDEVIANVLPNEKSEKIKEIQKKQNGLVAMVGDGINDAPALSQADVGIAMSTGTDVAIESAEVVLLKGDISKTYKAIKLSKTAIRIIRENLFWAFFYNILGIPLAAGLLFPLLGIILNPIFAGLAMAFSSVSVVANSLRLKFYKL